MFEMFGWLAIAGTGVAAVMVIVGTMQAQSAAVLRVVEDSRRFSRDRELRMLLDEYASGCGVPDLSPKSGWNRHASDQSFGKPMSSAMPVNAELLQLA